MPRSFQRGKLIQMADRQLTGWLPGIASHRLASISRVPRTAKPAAAAAAAVQVSKTPPGIGDRFPARPYCYHLFSIITPNRPTRPGGLSWRRGSRRSPARSFLEGLLPDRPTDRPSVFCVRLIVAFEAALRACAAGIQRPAADSTTQRKETAESSMRNVHALRPVRRHGRAVAVVYRAVGRS